MKAKRFLPALVVSALSIFASRAQAYLGGFEQADGYVYASTGYYNPPTFENWVDVSLYNAGQWGPNAGGGPLPIEEPLNAPANLWTLTSSAGAFYPNPTVRNTWLGAGPLYPATNPMTLPQIQATTATYMIGNHFGGRLGTTALAMRNAASFGPMSYDYRLDTFDYGGVAPASITSGTIKAGLYFQPNPSDNVTVAGPNGTPVPADKFIMSFADSSGSVGFQWGYLHDNSVVWRAGNAGAWNTTAFIGDPSGYDGITAFVDLSAQTFKLSYYDDSAATTTPLTAAIPMGNPMSNMTHIGWWLDQNLVSGVGGKNFFDDFSFNVPAPEPTSIALLGTGALLLMRRRTRRS